MKTEKKAHDEFKQCGSCINRYTEKPNPCLSCEQPLPTNYEEE